MDRRLLMLVSIGFTAISYADTEKVGKYTWSYEIIGKYARICASDTSKLPVVPAVSPMPTGSLTIPPVLGGMPVGDIGDYAFFNIRSINSVTIPQSVRTIGNNAFASCTALKNVTLPEGLWRIGTEAFAGCQFGSIVLPDGIEEIGPGAFPYCNSLTFVKFGKPNKNGYSIVGNLMVWREEDVQEKRIDLSGFGARRNEVQENTDKLLGSYRVVDVLRGLRKSKIVIPNGVTGISPYAFAGCKGLSEVTMPDSVTYIGHQAFANCMDLKRISIPQSVAVIEDQAFVGCGALTSINVDEKNPNYLSKGGFLLTKDGTTLIRGISGDAVIPEGVVTIKESAFSGCKNLTSITIPASVTKIEQFAFVGCDNLKCLIFAEREGEVSSEEDVNVSIEANALMGLYDCVVYVPRGVQYWWCGSVPGVWCGLKIEHMPEASQIEAGPAKKGVPQTKAKGASSKRQGSCKQSKKKKAKAARSVWRGTGEI